ncbi:MAG: hypothetical protein KJ666_01225 [Bacteroidetes bacterium]|nr:hypothetical protein [Bacteroidota bacterium]MBU2585238.1 hypothetical protein [Bacteroidota bacterium]
MLKKSFFIAAVITLMLSSVLFVRAQEKSSEKKDKQTQAQSEDMQKCMDKIASDSHMRGMMMQKMMDHTKVDSTGMMQMCKMMMDNPEMHKMMMKMMQGEGGMMDGKKMNHDMMKSDSTKTMNKSEHDSHHKK